MGRKLPFGGMLDEMNVSVDSLDVHAGGFDTNYSSDMFSEVPMINGMDEDDTAAFAAEDELDSSHQMIELREPQLLNRWEGYLMKRSDWVKNWDTYYFVLVGRVLYSYTSEDEARLQPDNSKIKLGKFTVSESVVIDEVLTVRSSFHYEFIFETEKGKRIHLRAKNEASKQLWMHMGCNAIVDAEIAQDPALGLRMPERHASLVDFFLGYEYLFASLSTLEDRAEILYNVKPKKKDPRAVVLPNAPIADFPPKVDHILNRFFSMCRPDVAMRNNYLPMVPFQGTYRGYPGLLEYFTKLSKAAAFKSFKVEGMSFEHADDKRLVVVKGRESMEVRGTGHLLTQKWAQKFLLKDDGTISRWEINGDDVASSVAFKHLNTHATKYRESFTTIRLQDIPNLQRKNTDTFEGESRETMSHPTVRPSITTRSWWDDGPLSAKSHASSQWDWPQPSSKSRMTRQSHSHASSSSSYFDDEEDDVDSPAHDGSTQYPYQPSGQKDHFYPEPTTGADSDDEDASAINSNTANVDPSTFTTPESSSRAIKPEADFIDKSSVHPNLVQSFHDEKTVPPVKTPVRETASFHLPPQVLYRPNEEHAVLSPGIRSFYEPHTYHGSSVKNTQRGMPANYPSSNASTYGGDAITSSTTFDYSLGFKKGNLWPDAPVPLTEDIRLDTAQRLDLCRPRADLTMYLNIACKTLRCPSGSVCIVGGGAGLFVAKIGIQADTVPRDICLESHVIMSMEPTIVLDASLDIRFAMNPLVTGEASVRFYIGIPLVSDGVVVGALSLMENAPRDMIKEKDFHSIVQIAQTIVHRVEDLSAAAAPSMPLSSFERRKKMDMEVD
ncbi:hypothetical protein LEN26_011614 [Aphanomyces euteiches]|nr:hypothetical protein LEN26_011614 [Aphanomyces euteiches]